MIASHWPLVGSALNWQGQPQAQLQLVISSPASLHSTPPFMPSPLVRAGNHMPPMPPVACKPGISPGCDGASTASTSRPTPTAYDSALPYRHTLSSTITAASATIQRRSITPSAINATINAQQQPTQ